MTIFRCECCSYTTSFKHHYESHLKSKKHLKNCKEENSKINKSNSVINYKIIIQLPKNLTMEEQMKYIDNVKHYEFNKIYNENKNKNENITIIEKDMQLFLNNQNEKINIFSFSNIENENNKKRICKNCNKEYSCRQTLSVHRKKCLNKKNDEEKEKL
jgi:hypothetical protein